MSTIVETQHGRIEGFQDAGLEVFLGIPYAAPPVGPRRFRAPEAPEPWSGVRDARQYGASAPQTALELGATMPGFDVGPQSSTAAPSRWARARRRCTTCARWPAPAWWR
jgi:hypothetical protein